jgi:protein Tex
VKVLEADPERKRISLTLRLDDEPATGGQKSGASGRQASGRQDPKQSGGRKPLRPEGGRGQSPKPAPANTAMAEALRKAGLGK